MNRGDILIVDDDLGIRELLSEILEDEGYSVHLAENAEQARAYRQESEPSLVLLDIWMPDTDGVTLLREWSANGQLTMPVVMLSGHATIETAVEATRIGAFDFLEKPVGLQKLLSTVSRALKTGQSYLPHPISLTSLGSGAAIQELTRCLQQLLRARLPILLTGEAGSGFDLCARALHHPDTPWIELDEPQRLLTNPLGLLEETRDGLIYCPNIAHYSKTEQKGLQFILTKAPKFNALIVCSSDIPLGSLASDGKFDAALLASLSAGTVTLTPLRQRRDDIPGLVEKLWREVRPGQLEDVLPFTHTALNALRNAQWPGNLAQLQSLINNLAMTGQSEITPELLQGLLGDSLLATPQPEITARFFELPLREAREAFERLYFEQLLGKEQNNMSRVAEKAGLERTHLYRKLKQLNIRFSRRNGEPSMLSS